MRKLVNSLALSICLIGVPVMAHQFTPTYPKFATSFVDGVLSTRMELFNKRQDVEYYQLDVYDTNWKPLPFATENKLINIRYLETKPVNVYIKVQDIPRVVYICTESKMRKENARDTVISSKICSKVK
jgi:hypothetical protein